MQPPALQVVTSEPGNQRNTPVTVARPSDSARLDDVFLSVKTTAAYHKARLPVILKTWFQLAKKQVSFCSKNSI